MEKRIKLFQIIPKQVQMNNQSINFEPIAYIESPYREKFAIPRQPGLVPAAKGKIILTPPYNQAEMVRGLETFSHVWVLFHFHATQSQGWKPLVRPPRLGGNKKLGVLATRSTFRPNSIGMSVIKLDQVVVDNKKVVLEISALDLLHGTPVLDIKPYIPYSDALPNAMAGYAQEAPLSNNIEVIFTHNVKDKLNKLINKWPNLLELINQVLQQDPRPAYKQGTDDDKVYGMQLYHFNIQWQFQDQSTIQVLDINDVEAAK